MSMKHILLAMALIAAIASLEAAPSPFFDAIYDAINGHGRRTYGYGPEYNNYGYNYQNNGYGYGHRRVEKPQRQGKTYKEICRVHFPDSIAQPGAGGIVCPY